MSTYLSYAVAGRTKMVYVPVDLEKDVRHWSGAYKAVKKLIAELCELQREIIRRHVDEQRRQR